MTFVRISVIKMYVRAEVRVGSSLPTHERTTFFHDDPIPK